MNTTENSTEITSPVPTKFFSDDWQIIAEAEKATGLSRSEIIRRSVRLLGKQKQMLNGFAFMLDLTRSQAA